MLIAGRQRAEVGCEWASHLAEVSDGRQVREAAGFVHAAISYRLQDLVDLLWIPADVVLASRELSTLAVLLATLTAAVISIHGGGLYGLVNNLANIAVVWAGSYGLIRVGRWWRGVKPPKHKPRRENE